MSIQSSYGGRNLLSEFEVCNSIDQRGDHVFEKYHIKQFVIREKCQNYVPLLQVIPKFTQREYLVPASFA